MIVESGAGPDELKAGPLILESLPMGVTVFVQGVNRGQTPLKLDSLPPGKLTLEFSSRGYRSLKTEITLESGRTYTLKIFLERSRGFLDMEVPSPARLFLEGQILTPLKDHFYELPTGKGSYILSVFGFEEERLEIQVEENQVLKLKPVLRPAPFRIKHLGLWPQVFNPENPGALGRLTAQVEVTAPGTVTLTLRSSDKAVVQTWELGPFTTWTQTVVLTALAEGLPDGNYTLEASGGEVSLSRSFRKSADHLLSPMTPTHPAEGTLKFLGAPVLPAGAFWLASQAYANPFKPSTWGISLQGTLGAGAGMEIDAALTVQEIPGALVGLRGRWGSPRWGLALDTSGEVDFFGRYRWTTQGQLSHSADSLFLGLGGGYVHTGIGGESFFAGFRSDGIFLQGETSWIPGEGGLSAGLRYFPGDARGEASLLGRILLPDTGAVFGFGASLIWSPEGNFSGTYRMETGFFL